MKKKLNEIMAVSSMFEVLTHKRFKNFSLSYKIAKAAKELNSHKDFYMSEERKIIETYAEKDENGQVKIIDGNRISFKDQKNALGFNKEINELANTEVDLFDPIEINLNDFNDGEMDLTPSDILNLEGFVVFIDNESNEKTIN